MPYRFCLVGQDIGASPSATMHTAALRACSVAGTYEIRDLSAADVPAFVRELRAGAYAGCNVTIPYKATLARLCDRLDDDAELIGAVNTIVADSDGLAGGNTDIAGFELGLRAAGLWPPPGCRAVVLGAGGAAAAAALALTRAPAEVVHIAARNPQTAGALAARLQVAGVVAVVEWERDSVRRVLAGADIVVNATPVGVGGMPFDVHDVPVSCTVADVRYRPRPVDLVAEARVEGRRACDGLEMLLQQGMLSFERWTGLPPPWAAARAALLEAVGE